MWTHAQLEKVLLAVPVGGVAVERFGVVLRRPSALRWRVEDGPPVGLLLAIDQLMKRTGRHAAAEPTVET
jgi:hypothetical protein